MSSLVPKPAIVAIIVLSHRLLCIFTEHNVFCSFLDMKMRSTKASLNHFIMYLDFLDENPGFLERKLSPGMQLVHLENRWNLLVIKLNASGFGVTKTPDEWKRTFSEWRSRVKKRYRDYITERNSTDGMNCTIKPPTELEERLLVHLGPESFSGDYFPEPQETSPIPWKIENTEQHVELYVDPTEEATLPQEELYEETNGEAALSVEETNGEVAGETTPARKEAFKRNLENEGISTIKMKKRRRGVEENLTDGSNSEVLNKLSSISTSLEKLEKNTARIADSLDFMANAVVAGTPQILNIMSTIADVLKNVRGLIPSSTEQ
ncbi:hypothetical protein L9F63_022356 [Diploptera punctata]|uniref:Regulatory protein zeste n=1 Tax=Diploptera punctata TaxID=6984 RepID=A0AAD8EB49_DIPPU|nr:hypothetical protein L9F63_022356 [Diploptera punctata]